MEADRGVVEAVDEVADLRRAGARRRAVLRLLGALQAGRGAGWHTDAADTRRTAHRKQHQTSDSSLAAELIDKAGSESREMKALNRKLSTPKAHRVLQLRKAGGAG